ncbi:MAG: hypothetical protein ABFC89_10715 [Methanospirillum sp.]
MADYDVIELIGLMISTGMGAVVGALVGIVFLGFIGMLDQSVSNLSPSEGTFMMAWNSLMNAFTIGFAAAGVVGADYIYIFKILGRQG